MFARWTDDIGNLLEAFAHAADALADVSLLADSTNPHGAIRLIARGPELVALARRELAGAAD